MGLFPTIQEEAKSKGISLAYKQIPMEVFDKRAVSKDEVIFHDVAYIEFKPIFKGKKLTKISPNKTISGSIGSFMFSTLLIPFFTKVKLIKH